MFDDERRKKYCSWIFIPCKKLRELFKLCVSNRDAFLECRFEKLILISEGSRCAWAFHGREPIDKVVNRDRLKITKCVIYLQANLR